VDPLIWEVWAPLAAEHPKNDNGYSDKAWQLMGQGPCRAFMVLEHLAMEMGHDREASGAPRTAHPRCS